VNIFPRIYFLFTYTLWHQTETVNVNTCEVIPTLILTLILLTWRIWWAPNNASKWHMGFNLAFKGLKAASFSSVT